MGSFYTGKPDPRAQHSFPTRRSSDLVKLTTGADNSWVVMGAVDGIGNASGVGSGTTLRGGLDPGDMEEFVDSGSPVDRKSTRLKSSHSCMSYGVSCVIKSFKPAELIA